jgi:hypothetical protein
LRHSHGVNLVGKFIEKSEAYAVAISNGHARADKINKDITVVADKMISSNLSSELSNLTLLDARPSASAWACMMLIQRDPQIDSEEKKKLAKRLRSLEGKLGVMRVMVIAFLSFNKL